LPSGGLAADHLCAQNGLKNPKDEPAEIQRVHNEMIAFVKEWLADWKPKNQTA
jgi:hypothetical protein